MLHNTSQQLLYTDCLFKSLIKCLLVTLNNNDIQLYIAYFTGTAYNIILILVNGMSINIIANWCVYIILYICTIHRRHAEVGEPWGHGPS